MAEDEIGKGMIVHPDPDLGVRFTKKEAVHGGVKTTADQLSGEDGVVEGKFKEVPGGDANSPRPISAESLVKAAEIFAAGEMAEEAMKAIKGHREKPDSERAETRGEKPQDSEKKAAAEPDIDNEFPVWEGRRWREIYADLRTAADIGKDPSSSEMATLIKEKNDFLTWLDDTGFFDTYKNVEGAINKINPSAKGGDVELAWQAVRDEVNAMDPTSLERAAVLGIESAVGKKTADKLLKLARGVYSNLQDTLSRDLAFYEDDANGTMDEKRQGEARLKQIYLGMEDMVPGTLRSLGKSLYTARAAAREKLAFEMMQKQAEAAARVQQAPAAPGFNPADLKEMFGSGAKYEDFIRRILKQDGAHTNWTDFPPPWYKNLPDELKTQAEFYESLANGSYVKKRSGQVKLEPVQNNEALPALDIRELRKFYESAGGRVAIESLMKEYFELYTDDFGYKWVRLKGYTDYKKAEAEINEENKKMRKDAIKIKEAKDKQKTYVDMKLNITDAGLIDITKKRIWGEIKALPGVIKEAKDMGLQGEDAAETVAKGKVANAWNFIYISHVVEAADVDRYLYPGAPSYVEQVRAEFHPLSKIKAKMKITTEGDPGLEREAWGGAVGAWLAEHATDEDLRRKVASGEIRPYPETLFASMLELIGEKDGASIAERLITGGDIVWKNITPQELIGYYGDLWSAATSIYAYATGGGEGKTQAGDNSPKWKAWGVDLANSFAKLRKTPVGVYCSDEEALFWMVANSLPVNIKNGNLSISNKGYPHLDITVDAMLGERLRYTRFDKSDKLFKEDRGVVGRIKKRIGATIAKSFLSGIK